jgi:D-alanyl-D-alanine dipeptidase
MRIARLLLLCLAGATLSARDLTGSIPDACGQVVLVVAPNWTSTTGVLQRYSRDQASAPWKPAGGPIPVLLGKGGLAWGLGLQPASNADAPQKREGDSRAPAGIFDLGPVFGQASRDELPWLRMPYQQLSPSTVGVDDPASRNYNHLVNREAIPAPDWHSCEKMWKVSDYEFGVVVGNNPECRPGAGSCIFFHLWLRNRDGTAGCTALHRADFIDLLRWLDSTRRPLLIQLPAAEVPRTFPGF